MKTLIEKIDEVIEALEEKEMESAVILMNIVKKKVEQADEETDEPREITPEYCSDYDTPYNEDDDDEEEEGFFDPTDLSDVAWWVK